MKNSFASLAALLTLANVASANTVFSQVWVNGVAQGVGVGVRVPAANNAITNINSPDLICNTGFETPVSQTVIPVTAGSQVTTEFHHKSAGYLGPDPADPLDPTDKGPVLAYLAKVPDATQSNVTGLQWFKIWQDGFDSATHQWGSDHLFTNAGKATFAIPSCLASGQYLLRAEVVGLEYATSYPGAEFWMSCAQLSITNSATAAIATKTPSTVSFPGAYNTGVGITASIYTTTSYTPPGPAVFTC